MIKVEFVGVLKAPETVTDPDTVRVLRDVFVQAPVVDNDPALKTVGVPPVTVNVPPLVNAAVTVRLPAPSVYEPEVTVNAETVRLLAPCDTLAVALFTVSPPLNVFVPVSVKASPAVFRVWSTPVVKLFRVRLFPFRFSAAPVREVVEVPPLIVTVLAELVTLTEPPLVIVAPTPERTRVTAPAVPSRLRVPVPPEVVTVPETVRDAAAVVPSVKVAPVLTVRLVAVAVPAKVTTAEVFESVTVANVWALGVTVWATVPLNWIVPVPAVKAVTLKFPPTSRIPDEVGDFSAAKTLTLPPTVRFEVVINDASSVPAPLTVPVTDPVKLARVTVPLEIVRLLATDKPTPESVAVAAPE
jgi:hypothetical protein